MQWVFLFVITLLCMFVYANELSAYIMWTLILNTGHVRRLVMVAEGLPSESCKHQKFKFN